MIVALGANDVEQEKEGADLQESGMAMTKYESSRLTILCDRM